MLSKKSPLTNGHFENLNNFTTAEISVEKRHPMLMLTLTICKLLCGMPKERALITRTLCKPNFALQYDIQINF